MLKSKIQWSLVILFVSTVNAEHAQRVTPNPTPTVTPRPTPSASPAPLADQLRTCRDEKFLLERRFRNAYIVERYTDVESKKECETLLGEKCEGKLQSMLFLPPKYNSSYCRAICVPNKPTSR